MWATANHRFATPIAIHGCPYQNLLRQSWLTGHRSTSATKCYTPTHASKRPEDRAGHVEHVSSSEIRYFPQRILVGEAGFEPARPKPHAPKACASTIPPLPRKLNGTCAPLWIPAFAGMTMDTHSTPTRKYSTSARRRAIPGRRLSLGPAAIHRRCRPVPDTPAPSTHFCLVDEYLDDARVDEDAESQRLIVDQHDRRRSATPPLSEWYLRAPIRRCSTSARRRAIPAPRPIPALAAIRRRCRPDRDTPVPLCTAVR